MAHPLSMHSESIDLLFAKGDGIRISKQLAKLKSSKNPKELASHLSGNIKSFLASSDYLGAEALVTESKHKYSNKAENYVIREVEIYFETLIHFAFARYAAFEENYHSIREKYVESQSVLSLEDLIILDKLLAEKYFHFNENKALNELALLNEKIYTESELAIYLKKQIIALNLCARGEYVKALHAAEINLKTAQLNEFVGFFAPLACGYIKSICYFSLTKKEEALELLKVTSEMGLNFNRLDWHLVCDGQLTRQLGAENKIIDALAKIRFQRERVDSLTQVNGFNFFVDANELYVRTLMKDENRVQVLIKRLPEISLVKQAKANHTEWNGGDILKWIEGLPEDNPREKLYKLFAFAEYYQEAESLAIFYMKSALALVEETGSIEFLLRQHNLAHVILKAIPEYPNAFQEGLAKKLTERVAFQNDNLMTGLRISLSKRELEILTLLATGLKIREIGLKLNISMNTMKTHVKSVYRKLDVDSREDALAKAEQLLLI